jgi:phosphatidylinositol alpha-mannosyltransferase
MAAGRPVVASDIAGYRGVMRENVEGLFFPPKDVDALVAALVKLADAPDLRARLGAAGEARARDYSWDKIAARVLEVYQATAASIRPRRSERRTRRRILGGYLRRLSGLLVPLGSSHDRYAS